MERQTAENILGAKTLRDLEALKRSGVLNNFYLGGGTGAALHLRHRRSFDLDFFTAKPFNETLLVKKLSGKGVFTLEAKEPGTVVGAFNDTRVSFFHYPYPLLKRPVATFGVNVAHLADLACMKLDAIASRGSKKDFIDFYFILQRRYRLVAVFRLFKKKYKGVAYNSIHIQKGLVFFAAADAEKMPRMLAPLSWETVKAFFRREIKELSR